MKLITKLDNATEQERTDFIVDYNHNQGYEIKEEIVRTEEIQDEEGNIEVVNTYNLEAWGYTEEEIEQAKKERIAMLSLTRGDVFRGLLMAKQVTRQQIRAMIENNETLTILQKEMALIDFDEALNFYRGNALIDTLGATLGITSQQLDKFFEDGNYEHLLEEKETFNLEV